MRRWLFWLHYTFKNQQDDQKTPQRSTNPIIKGKGTHAQFYNEVKLKPWTLYNNYKYYKTWKEF